MKRYAYDYYTVSVPGDAFDSIEDAGQCAIREAEERSRIWATPAHWEANLIRGELGSWELLFRVCRKRMRS